MSVIALPFFLVALVALVVGLGGTILWVWMLIDCATKEPSGGPAPEMSTA
jgi:hypothetical protein